MIGSGQTDPNKDAAVMNMKDLETKKEVRQMLRFFSWLRDYIPDFALYAKPLTNLTGERVSFNVPWSKIHQDAFERLKETCVRQQWTPNILLIFQNRSMYVLMGVIVRFDAP